MGNEIDKAFDETERRYTEEIERLKKDLEINADLLAKQTDMAREAENQRDGLKKSLKRKKDHIDLLTKENAEHQRKVAELEKGAKTAEAKIAAGEEATKTLRELHAKAEKAAKDWMEAFQASEKESLTLMSTHADVENRAEATEAVVQEAALFERAATKEINEKGAGGYALARLSDLRVALSKHEASMKGNTK